MEHWKITIEAGNRCFRAGDWVVAREYYLQALAEAQLLFERWRDPDAIVAAFVISHHNLADLHLALGQPEEAAENLCASHERLLQAMSDQRLSAELRDAALQHSRHTYTELLHFIGEHGAYPRTDRLLGQTATGSSRSRIQGATLSRYHH